jgi:hypothetical protein
MNVAGTGVNAMPMLIKAYRIESRRHGSIDCQPVLMGILHLRYEQMTITANAVMVNCHSGYINWETI